MVAEEIFLGGRNKKQPKIVILFYFLNKKCHFGFFVYLGGLEILKKDFFVGLGLSKIAETHEHIHKYGKNDRLIF